MDNINELLNIDFSLVNDEFNWLTNSSIPIVTVSGQLKLVPEAPITHFTRGLGVLDPTNDRIRVQCNLDLFRPQTSPDETMSVVLGVYVGSTLIDQFSIYADEMASGDRLEYNFDRIYKYEDLASAISLKITVPEGYENQVFLDYLKAWDFRFNENDVRSYFVVNNLLEDSVASVSSGVQLLKWEIDDVETLTADFFIDNPNVGGDPIADWKMAQAEIDGSNRVADIVDQNSFNPLVHEWGLTFENVAGNYFGGKPTGTASGKDYGAGILKIGFEKPAVLNGLLDSKDGAFFIDIDYSKNLLVQFNILVNNTNVDVFNSPDSYKKFTIKWDAETCTKQFYYQDQLAVDPSLLIPVDEDGFLAGITGEDLSTETIDCSESFAYSGNLGVFEFIVTLGNDVGETGIDWNAIDLPDKFEIEWDGNIYSTGYVGSDAYDQQLLNLGIKPKEINTGGATSGQLLFQKTTPTPTTAKVRVTAPLQGTEWSIDGICPDGVLQIPPTVDMTTVKTLYELNENVTFNIIANDTDGTVDSWSIDFGDGTNDSGGGNPTGTNIKAYEETGEFTAIITVTDNDGLTATSEVVLNIFTNVAYQLTGDVYADCNAQMNGTLTVITGTVTVKNFFEDINPVSISATLAIDGENLTGNETHLLTPGVYPFTSDTVDCTNGNGYNEFTIL